MREGELEVKIRSPRLVLAEEYDTYGPGSITLLLLLSDVVEADFDADGTYINPDFPNTEIIETEMKGEQVYLSPNVFYVGLWDGNHHFSISEQGIYQTHICDETDFPVRDIQAIYDNGGNQVYPK